MAANQSSELTDSYRVHVLELPAGMDDQVESNVSLVLVLLKRHTGALLAVPEGFFSEESLAMGLTAGPDDQLGQSIHVTVPAGEKLDMEDVAAPSEIQGTFVSLVIIDVSDDIMSFVTPFSFDNHDLDLTHAFDSSSPYIFPLPGDLTRSAWEWIADPSSGQRMAFYSADEGVMDGATTPVVPLPPREGAAKSRAAPSTRSVPKAVADGQKRPRPTVATLAVALEKVVEALPGLTQQVAMLQQKTDSMEEKFLEGLERQSRPSALRQPLGTSTISGLSQNVPAPSALVREMPPPSRSLSAFATPASKAKVSFAAAQEAEELEQEKMETEEGSELARAVLAQSQALTTLVQHLASSDPLPDLASSSSSSISSKGTMGRQRLQQELAQQTGGFFLSVLQSMARRMQPTRIAEQSPAELSARGITPTAYLEKYGGYGRTRDLGALQWQVGLILEHLQHDNLAAAKDATALLCVCIEQGALDGGRLDIGLLLSLTEEPPAGVFSNRSMSGIHRGRPFAPLASQKWVTTTLAFIKEMDLIAARRLEATGGNTKKDSNATDAPDPKKAAKKQPKGKGKQRSNAGEDEE